MIGRELNPRIGDFDIKFFTELRPGLIGWIILNVCFAVKQYSDLERITNSMALVLFFHTFYVVDALWNEEACLTTMDVTTGKYIHYIYIYIYVCVCVCVNFYCFYLSKTKIYYKFRWFWFHAWVWIIYLGANALYPSSTLSRRFPS